MKLLAVPPTDLAEYSALPESCRSEVSDLLRAMAAICSAQRGAIQATIAHESRRVGLSAKRLRGLWDNFRKSGNDWRTLINRAKYPASSEKLSDHDVTLFRTYAERNQRKSRPAHRELVRAWRRGEVQTSTPVDPTTGLPRGWSYRNLMRYQSSRFELTAMRQGLGAAISQHLGKVLRTRVGLWVGSHYVPDDVVRDFKVLLLQGRAGKEARVAELGVLDLYSAHRFTVHRRPEFRRDEDGKMDKIKEREMRFVVAAVLRNTGYSPRGTQWLVELGTAAIRTALADWLQAHSNGLVTVKEAGITGRNQALAELTGRGGGNAAHKTWLESHHNLLHNEAGHLLAATGHDRNPPEWLFGFERENASVIKHLLTLPPERAGLLRTPMLEYWQALTILREIDQVIAERTDHDLEGWVECGHTTIEYRSDLTRDEWLSQKQFLKLPPAAQQTILSLCEVTPTGTVARPRKLSPLEVYQRGVENLIRMPDHVIALLFADKQLGDDLREARRLTKDGEFEITDKTITPDTMVFQGVATTPDGQIIKLDERITHATVLNPFDLDSLWVYDANGAYIGTTERRRRASLADSDAAIPQLATRSHSIAALTAPLRERHADIANTIRDIQLHNAALLSAEDAPDPESTRANRSATRAGRALLATQPSEPPTEPDPQGPIEDWTDSPIPIGPDHSPEHVETW